MMNIEVFKTEHPEVVEMLGKFSEDELSALMHMIWNRQDDIKPRFSCKRGDVVKFWSTWTDTHTNIRLDYIERIAIALDDCNNVLDSTMLEYMPEYRCWRYQRVGGDRFLEIVGHLDMDHWEQLTTEMWKEVKE